MAGKIKVFRGSSLQETFEWTEELENLFKEREELMKLDGLSFTIEKPKTPRPIDGLHRGIIRKVGNWKTMRTRVASGQPFRNSPFVILDELSNPPGEVIQITEVRWIGVQILQQNITGDRFRRVAIEDFVWLKLDKDEWKEFLLRSIDPETRSIRQTFITEEDIMINARDIPTFELYGKVITFNGSWRDKWCHNPKDLIIVRGVDG